MINDFQKHCFSTGLKRNLFVFLLRTLFNTEKRSIYGRKGQVFLIIKYNFILELYLRVFCEHLNFSTDRLLRNTDLKASEVTQFSSGGFRFHALRFSSLSQIYAIF